MTDLLADVEAYFLANTLTTGYSIFKDTMLDTPDDAVGIYEYAGAGGPTQVAGALRSLQIVVRAKSVKNARVQINSLYKALNVEDGVINFTVDRWATVFLRQTPFKLKADTSGRTYYAFNMGVNTYLD
jgi:hypothetical protein